MTQRRAAPAQIYLTQRRMAAGSIRLPTHCFPEQGVAVFEILDELRAQVCAHDGLQIQQVLRDEFSPMSPATGDIEEAEAPILFATLPRQCGQSPKQRR